MFHGQRNNSGSTVAKGQALHDTQNTDAVESPDGCPELFAEAETFMGACPVVTESGAGEVSGLITAAQTAAEAEQQAAETSAALPDEADYPSE